MRASLVLVIVLVITVCGLFYSPALSTVITADPPILSNDVYYKTQGMVSGPPAPHLSSTDYPTLPLPGPWGESRLIIWCLAQQHLYFGGVVLGGLFLTLAFELRGLFARVKDTAQLYDDIAKRMLAPILLVISLTAVLGGLLLFALLSLYPDLTLYLAHVFQPFFLIYGVLVLVFSAVVYLYYAAWARTSRSDLKWGHVGVGLLVNLLGIALMAVANSWGTFMMSPAGVDQQGRFLGHYWHVLRNALWMPLNVHRFFGNITFGAAVMVTYAAYQTLNSKNQDERASYERMSHACFLCLVGALFTLPYGGYWLSKELYGYRQQMGIMIFGGLLAWFNIILVLLIGLLFLAINYYLWLKIDSEHEGGPYRHHIKYIFLILVACVLVYITPHTLVITPVELKAMGGQQHPIVGNYGVESSKQPAINIMMLVTVWSWLMLWKNRYLSDKSRHLIGDLVLLGLFLGAAINIIGLGIYGYYIPANVRVGLSIPMVFTTLSAAVIGAGLTMVGTRRRAVTYRQPRGTLSARALGALYFITVIISLLMGVGGYMRSAVRIYWHIMEISRDTSPWAFTHTIGFAANVISFNVLFFWGVMLVVFWLSKRQAA
jgi:cytochrome d ubiquinol oxidase subunit I